MISVVRCFVGIYRVAVRCDRSGYVRRRIDFRWYRERFARHVRYVRYVDRQHIDITIRSPFSEIAGASDGEICGLFVMKLY